MAFKRDDSFLQYLSMGAVGSARVAADLNVRGHQIIELERYTTSNKIWATKVKRLRLPDLLCLRCGVRVEVRAKSKLEVKLSDSPAVAGRTWDAGLDDGDLIAFIQVSWKDDTVVGADWVEYFHVSDLRATVGASRLGQPKSPSEGAERTRTWPVSVAVRNGIVTATSPTHVTIAWEGGPTRRLSLRPGFQAYVGAGAALVPGRLISGIASRPETVACPGEVWDLVTQSTSPSPGSRYAAIKALAFRGEPDAALPHLLAAWQDDAADPRIRLEALAGLARREPNEWVPVLVEFRQTLEADLAMEAILILSEVRAQAATEALVAVIDDASLPDELRAAAAWGIGIGGHSRPELLLAHLNAPSDEVAVHSLVAIGTELSDALLEQVADGIANGERTAAASIQVLATHGVRGARVLLQRINHLGAGRAKAWALFGLGLLGREAVEAAAEGQVPAELSAALEPLWVGLTENWLAGERAASLNVLRRQTVRETIGGGAH